MRLSRTLLVAALAASPALAASVPGWISDDYAGALAEARERRLPLFVDAWAPW
ncbi:MAG TPA: hypothetical protein VMK42_08630 [Anaeromyxobacteraceae bacterium]|nr:hypothetical protein [Anaeromyxobacteraceae bacterium]